MFTGFQRSQRKKSFERDGVKNTNVAVGLNAVF
jgi:hypothetical protein